LAIVGIGRMRKIHWRCDAITALAACTVTVVCWFLPMKNLDIVVGPIDYPEMPLTELCNRLYADYGVYVMRPQWGVDRRLAFSTDRPMSRREVLEKLSEDTHRPLHIGYCGTDATILFGAHPSFTYLEPPELPEPSVSPEPTALEKQKLTGEERKYQEDDIYEAVFRWQLQQYESIRNKNIKVYFFSLGNDDPSFSFLKRFADHDPPILRGSDANTFPVVVDKITGEKGAMFFISSIQWISDAEVRVKGGVSIANLNGYGGDYKVVKEKGKWTVVGENNSWMSQDLHRRRFHPSQQIAMSLKFADIVS
jgi:hypothetical protein